MRGEPGHEHVEEVVVLVDVDGGHADVREGAGELGPQVGGGFGEGQEDDAEGDEEGDVEAEVGEGVAGDEAVAGYEGFEDRGREVGEAC